MRVRFLLATLLAVSTSAVAEERGPAVRQFVGLSAVAADSGFGLGAQLGLRAGPSLLRLTLDIGGGSSNRGYALGALRGGVLLPLGVGAHFLAGAGIGSLSYGFIFDDPAASLTVALPEVGILFGGDRTFGRVLLGVTGVIPLAKVAHPADSFGQTIDTPKVLFNAVLSL
jgi:hypothetical protein